MSTVGWKKDERVFGGDAANIVRSPRDWNASSSCITPHVGCAIPVDTLSLCQATLGSDIRAQQCDLSIAAVSLGRERHVGLPTSKPALIGPKLRRFS